MVSIQIQKAFHEMTMPCCDQWTIKEKERKCICSFHKHCALYSRSRILRSNWWYLWNRLSKNYSLVLNLRVLIYINLLKKEKKKTQKNAFWHSFDLKDDCAIVQLNLQWIQILCQYSPSPLTNIKTPHQMYTL